MMQAMGLFFLVMIAIIVLAAVLVWLTVQNGSSGRKGKSSGSFGLLTADDFDTGLVSLTATATGTSSALDSTGFITILSTNLCTARCQNRLYADVSLETAITALSDIPTGAESAVVATTIGVAAIDVQVLVDGIVAQPGIVTFDGLLRIISQGLEPLTEALDVLSLAEANAFTFVYQGIKHGQHTVEVQARLTAIATPLGAIAETVTASISNRSLVVTQGNAFVAPIIVPLSPAPCCSSRF
jgi:hypothetical protein